MKEKIRVSLYAIIISFCLVSMSVQAKEIFKIQEISKGGGYFIINDNQFSVRSGSPGCFKMHSGDPIRFVEGGPSGICITATFVNLRNGETCDVWCH